MCAFTRKNSISGCVLDNEHFMSASSLRDCLTSLEANSAFHQVDYIETYYGHDEYLQNVCQSIYPYDLEYDKTRTENQTDDCESHLDGWMYPSHCSDGWLKCDSTKNGCIRANYAGFFCLGI